MPSSRWYAPARLDVAGRLGLVYQVDRAVGFDRLHEGVGHADRHVEVGQIAAVLGVDELLDVRVIAAQYAHLRAATAAGGLDRFARAVEHPHVADRAGGARLRAAHARTDRADAGEVVTDAATAAHGFRCLRQRGVDARALVFDFGDRIADRLHEAVDQRGGELGAGGGTDAPRGHEAALLRVEEFRFPVRAAVFRLGLGERFRHTAAHFADRGFTTLGVLLDQYFAGNFLLRQGCLAWMRRWVRWRSRSWSFSSSVVGPGTDGRIARNLRACKKIKSN
jgi:hypothetical protein